VHKVIVVRTLVAALHAAVGGRRTLAGKNVFFIGGLLGGFHDVVLVAVEDSAVIRQGLFAIPSMELEQSDDF